MIEISSSYKLIIPLNIEQKIRFLCNNINNIEWSGILFYDYTGRFEDGSLELTCKDIYVMDIGNSVATKFSITPEVSGYIADNLELLSCSMGLVHSHHSMATFFSGTDTNTLKIEGEDNIHFLSLIVNNAGTYNAKITKKIKAKHKINTEYTYQTFDSISEGGEDYSEQEEEYLEAHSLIIDKYEDTSSEKLLERINSLKDKIKNPKFVYPKNINSIDPPTWDDYNREDLFSNINSETALPKESLKSIPVDFNKLDSIIIPKKELENTAIQLLTCNPIIHSSFEVDVWMLNMEKLLDKRFTKDATCKLYSEYITEFISFIMYNQDLEDMIESKYDLSVGEFQAVLANNLIEYFKKLPINKYIKELLTILNEFTL